MQRKPIFNYEDYTKVIEYFNTNDNNKTPVIAKKLGYTISVVNYYIDVYLALKRNYMGAEIDMPSSNFDYKNTENKKNQNKINIECYENDVYLGSFNSITSAANFLNVKREAIYGKFKRNVEEITIMHRKPYRIITYKLIK